MLYAPPPAAELHIAARSARLFLLGLAVRVLLLGLARGVLEHVVRIFPVPLPHELPGAGILLLLRWLWLQELVVVVVGVPSQHGGDVVLLLRRLDEMVVVERGAGVV
jgi:hypothetical protein